MRILICAHLSAARNFSRVPFFFRRKVGTFFVRPRIAGNLLIDVRRTERAGLLAPFTVHVAFSRTRLRPPRTRRRTGHPGRRKSKKIPGKLHFFTSTRTCAAPPLYTFLFLLDSSTVRRHGVRITREENGRPKNGRRV